MQKELTNKQQARLSLREVQFVDLLPANDWIVWKAGIAAGFSENYARHRLPARMLSNVALKQAIEAKQTQEQAENIANREQRQQFWTRLMLGQVPFPCNASDKLRASELLGKSECDFIEKSINLNADIPTEPKAYKAWLQSELDRLKASDDVIDSYAKSKSAIAERS